MTTSNETPGDKKPEAASAPSNFLREIIDRDLASGLHQGRVVTRFPPEPNGYLHIGHAKSICLNFGLAKTYGGVCHLRMDDTNPETEDMEYVEAIQRDVKWLGFDWADKLFYASDYYDRLWEFAIQLIKAGKAYVCSLSEEEFRKHRGTVTEPGTPSPYRSRTVEENLDLFERMRKGEFPDGAHVLRGKMDMQSPNMKMRDWPFYRIRHESHYRAGDKWSAYPLYDFAHCLSDYIEGITHSICTLEFENNRELYDWILEAVGAPPSRPHQYEFARLNLTYTMMSKRKLLELVEKKIVSGWDDPRMPTISAMRRRGYTPEAIRDLAERVGVAKNNSIVDFALLEYVLREDLDKRSPRVMAVLRPLKVTIETMAEGAVEELDAPLWPDAARGVAGAKATSQWEGSRKVPFSRVIYIDRDDFLENPPKDYHRLSPGKEVRLRHAYVIKCERVVKDDKGEIVEIVCSHDPASRGEGAPSGKRIKGTIHWVSAAHAVDAEVRLYDQLFLSEQPAISENMHEDLNPDSLVVVQAKLEPSLAAAKPGDRFQFERQGFFFVDPVSSKDGALVYNRTVGLKDSWAKIAKAASPETVGPAPKKEASPKKEQAPKKERAEVSLDSLSLPPEDKAVLQILVNEGLREEVALLAEEKGLLALFAEAIHAKAPAKAAAKLVTNEVRALFLKAGSQPVSLDGARIAELLALIAAGDISPTIAKEVLAETAGSGESPKAIVEKKGIRQIVDTAALDAIAAAVLAENADLVARYRAGNPNLFGAIVGAAMKKTGGKANAKALQDALKRALS